MKMDLKTRIEKRVCIDESDGHSSKEAMRAAVNDSIEVKRKCNLHEQTEEEKKFDTPSHSCNDVVRGEPIQRSRRRIFCAPTFVSLSYIN